MIFMNRRQFMAAAAAGVGTLRAKERKNAIGRNRISAISDEIATSPAEAAFHLIRWQRSRDTSLAA